MHKRRTRPPRGDIDEAALGLLARHGAQILATARRYAASPEDAEDAYQRALEILLTKAPTTREDELMPWLKTVIKHEAFALRRQRDRVTPVTGDGEAIERGTAAAATHDQAERYERLRQGAEALRRLKPQEIRCLVLKARGLSYREICDATGFSYTKVNRCLTEGRQALTVQMAGIEGGIECARLAPLLSALADGEASAQDLAVLRPHMRTCLACRARLREFRATPARVAALLPPVTLLAADPQGGGLRGLVEGLIGASQHKAAVLGERAHTAAELITGQKVAALTAGAVALAGGGTAVDQFANHRGPPQRPAAAAQSQAPAPEDPAAAPDPSPPAVALEQPAATERAASPVPEPPPPEPPPPPDPANEFGPTAAPVAPSPASAAAAPPAPAPRPDPSALAGGQAAEFAP
ncbi:MAG: hypothetical protein QOH58_2483 [Thermoleophilaceae bacterium]|jgi:RNA polymerase sigma factor (sigma-70 family)|nr:hypothetical protein [Thermoleophilaceae bacterium]